MAKLTYDEILADLLARKRTMRCEDLVAHLRALGFVVKQGKNGKHHTYTHPKITRFSGNFDCGHGRNPQVLPVYIGKVIKVIEDYETDLR